VGRETVVSLVGGVPRRKMMSSTMAAVTSINPSKIKPR
jgi:hypothetical protein